MSQKVREITISNATRQKVQAAKSYIEQRYSKLLQQQRQKRQYWDQLNKKMQELQLPAHQQNQIKKKIIHEQAEILRQQRTKITIMDFTPLKIIGKGAFGEVRLCKWNKNSEPVAIKKLKKSQMIFKNKVIQSRQERNVLAVSQKNPWIVNLKCSFQDPDNLYLVMEYLPGGDLMNLLMKKDIFTHQQAQFYTAEILMALDTVHKMKYIHRDLKPDNVLLDATGHIKLSDFGLCKHTEIRPKKLTDNLIKKQTQTSMGRRGDKDKFSNDQFQKDYHRKMNRKLAFSAVGTPDYVAPQVQGRVGYTQTVDWWSMGVILYEMLVGYPPFASEQPRQTWHKIQNWRKYLVIPKDADVSPQAADLIRKLIADPKDRLGMNGVQEIKAHPFFAGINWSKLRDRKSPYIPQVKGSWDTRNFDPYEEQEPWFPVDQGKKKQKKKNTQFIGYTYKPIQQPNSALLKALVDLQNNRIPQIQHKNALDYLGLDRQLDDYQISSLNNRFKKDKTQRINKEFYATTALFGSKPGSKFQQRDKQRYKCYFNEPGERKLIGQQLITSTTTSTATNNTSTPNQQKIISSIKKQSPATKYEKQKDVILRDDKKIKVKMLQKKIG